MTGVKYFGGAPVSEEVAADRIPIDEAPIFVESAD